MQCTPVDKETWVGFIIITSPLHHKSYEKKSVKNIRKEYQIPFQFFPSKKAENSVKQNGKEIDWTDEPVSEVTINLLIRVRVGSYNVLRFESHNLK